ASDWSSDVCSSDLQRCLGCCQIGCRCVHGCFPTPQCRRCVVEILFSDNFFVTKLGDAVVILLGVIQIHSCLLGGGAALQDLGLRLFHCDFEIALIEHDQSLTRLD